MRRRRRDTDAVDVSDLSPDELHEVRLAWWRAKTAAAMRGTEAHLAWVNANPYPGPRRYEHLRRPGV